MRRALITSFVLVVGLSLVMPRGGNSVEDAFVATTEAAEDAEGSTCMMPDAAPAAGEPGQQLAVPKSTSADGGDLPPVRMVVDPYPSFDGIVVDMTTDQVMMSDTNRKSLLIYDRTGGSNFCASFFMMTNMFGV